MRKFRPKSRIVLSETIGSPAVVDADGKLLGHITIDDVVDVIMGGPFTNISGGLRKTRLQPYGIRATQSCLAVSIWELPYRIFCDQSVPGHHRKSGGFNRADANCCLNGWNRRHQVQSDPWPWDRLLTASTLVGWAKVARR